VPWFLCFLAGFAIGCFAVLLTVGRRIQAAERARDEALAQLDAGDGDETTLLRSQLDAANANLATTRALLARTQAQLAEAEADRAEADRDSPGRADPTDSHSPPPSIPPETRLQG
jgi:hypothetical protein